MYRPLLPVLAADRLPYAIIGAGRTCYGAIRLVGDLSGTAGSRKPQRHRDMRNR